MSDPTGSNHSHSDVKHWFDHGIWANPLFLGFLTMIALAISFNPKASNYATFICLGMAWLLATRLIYTQLKSRHKGRLTCVLSVLIFLILGVFGLWLAAPIKATIAEAVPSPSIESKQAPAATPTPSVSRASRSQTFLEVEPEKLCAFFDKYNFAQAQDLIKPYLGKWMHAEGTVLEVRYETFYAGEQSPSKMGITVWIESTRIYKGTHIAVFAMFDDPQGIERAKVLKNKERIKLRGQIESVRAHHLSLQHSEIIE